MVTSEHKQFILTHKDTFSHSHLTKQPTGSRTDTSLSALCSPFSEIAAPAVIKPGSHFLPFCCLNPRDGFWVKGPRSAPPYPRPPVLAAGSQRSHFLLGEGNCRSAEGFEKEKGRSQFSFRNSSPSSSSLLSEFTKTGMFHVVIISFELSQPTKQRSDKC